MAATDDFPVDVSTKGDFRSEDVAWATERIVAVTGKVSDPVVRVELRLTHQPNVPRRRPYLAEASISVEGTPIRSHVAAPTLTEAIDFLVDRLQRRVVRHEDRRHRIGRRHDTGDSGEHEWRHGDLPAHRPEYFDRPYDERQLVARKTLALEPLTIDEAAFDLDVLGHDFYLFCEARSGLDAVIAYEDDVLVLWHPAPDALDLDHTAVAVTLRTSGVPSCTPRTPGIASTPEGSRTCSTSTRRRGGVRCCIAATTATTG